VQWRNKCCGRRDEKEYAGSRKVKSIRKNYETQKNVG
jgi:hypothetical protein